MSNIGPLWVYDYQCSISMLVGQPCAFLLKTGFLNRGSRHPWGTTERLSGGCKQRSLLQCSSTFLSMRNPWYTSPFVMEPLLTKLKKSELLVRKSNIWLLDTSTNKQLLYRC